MQAKTWKKVVEKKKAARRKAARANSTGRSESAPTPSKKAPKDDKDAPRRRGPGRPEGTLTAPVHAMSWVRIAGHSQGCTHVAELPTGMLFREQGWNAYNEQGTITVALQFVPMSKAQQSAFWRGITIVPEQD